ncbi:MAG TPA: exodeoxyribonuclease VII small subunit [Thermodesulfobacteriota bacterium]|nr:exodeoxyribonuclease VII small subunit [Thermodesulfobacteriota bacterium]
MKSFEGALDELKVIIEKLEGGKLSLEDSLTLFEKGTQLINLCHKKLNEVEKKIEILVEGTNGEVTRKEFDLEE